ncbi:MAG: hypothetical protein KJZ65_02845 [Phycisphaerales bacterium]|nr:hypothetical protein [Phycisphaerales bacterium]
MLRRLTQIAVLAGVPVVAPALAQAQEHMFRTWFEAPESVMAGDTFQVWLWAKYEVNGVPILGIEGRYLNGVYASVETAGSLGSLDHLSPVLAGFYRLSPGTSDGA